MKAHTRQIIAFSGLFACVGFLALTSLARADALTTDDLLAQFGSRGSGAGQLKTSGAIASSPVTGHVFIADNENRRIDEFTPWGKFVKAFGWDPAPGAVNEQQEVTVKATAGQFKLTFGASATGDLEHNAPASEAEGSGSVEAALNGLASVSGGSVSVEKGPSDISSSRYVISFSGGTLAGADVAQVTASSGTIPLGGGVPSSAVTVTTRADGTPGGTGLESCTAESGCQDGTLGVKAGQLQIAQGLAVDPAGNIYVHETGETNLRIQKFDSSGRFVWMIGGEVDKTTHANICTAADESSGDECGAGVPGTAPGQFSKGAGIAVGPTGNVFVADAGRIQEFSASGAFISAVSVPGKIVRDLAIDSTGGDFYASYGIPSVEENVHKLSPSGAELCSFPVPRPVGLAADSAGGLYAGDTPQNGVDRVLSFSGNCNKTAPSSELSWEPPPREVRAIATNAAGDLLLGRSGEGLSFVQIYGPPPVNFEPPPAVPPTIATQYAIDADPEDATVRAEINPHFWTDTRYWVEYGGGKCSEGGCESQQPLPPGTLLSTKVSGDPVMSGGVLLQGLEPATTYHYRFVANSGGGGPVRGVGGEVGADGAEGSFRTPPLPGSAETGCPNQAFRNGASAALPDCRAYEMVSPVEKNNGDIRDRTNVSGLSVGLRQSAPDGESLTYSSYRAFADPLAGPYSVQYLARRGAGGWSSEGLMHARVGRSVFGPVAAVENEFKAFSPDLCSSWLVDPSSLPYAPGAPENFPNLYRRDNCSESYEALTTAQPTDILPSKFLPDQLPELQGFSADGSKAVIGLPYQMAEGAVKGKYQAYEASGGEMRLVCILPNETPLGGGCSTGGGGFGSSDEFHNRGSVLSHAISEDGSRIYWTDTETGPGKIYLRLNGSETVAVSETETTAKSQFLGASADGSSALFLPTEKAKASKLFKYSLQAEASSEIAGEVIGVAGMSEDLSHVYFVSKEAIGGKGTAGQPNLYLNHEGTNTFIATLAQADIETNNEGHYSDIATQPVYHVARATPDGAHLAFISTRPLTGYDNTDIESGKADFEIFRYSAGAGELNCTSCDPSGARPKGREVRAPFGASSWFAALIPAGETQLYTPRAQSDDGNRLFFTSYGPLVARDTNGVADVYEWEAPGTGGCSEGASAYSPANGGCVYLISSGVDGVDSELVDSSANGGDVFIATDDSLLSQDPGLVDIYDARVSGGFPPPPSQLAACEGEACQGPSSPPNDPTPGSSSFDGAGNVREASAKKHKKRKHAKSQKHAKKHKHAKSKRRNAR